MLLASTDAQRMLVFLRLILFSSFSRLRLIQLCLIDQDGWVLYTITYDTLKRSGQANNTFSELKPNQE